MSDQENQRLKNAMRDIKLFLIIIIGFLCAAPIVYIFIYFPIYNYIAFKVANYRCNNLVIIDIIDNKTWINSLHERISSNERKYLIKLEPVKWRNDPFFPQISISKMPIIIKSKIVGYKNDVSYSPISIFGKAGRSYFQCYFSSRRSKYPEISHIESYHYL